MTELLKLATLKGIEIMLKETSEETLKYKNLYEKSQSKEDMLKKEFERYRNEVSASPFDEPAPDNPSLGNTWRERVINTLKENKRVMKNEEIAHYINLIDTSLDKNKTLNLVQGAVNKLVKEEKLRKYQPKKMKGYYYGSPTWWDDHNELYNIFKPVEKSLF